MPRDASGDVRLPHVTDVHPDVATFMIARAFAETYRDVLERRSRTARGHPAADGQPGGSSMNAMQPEPHIALIVEDDPDVRELATALLEETSRRGGGRKRRGGAGLSSGPWRRGGDDLRRCPPAR